MFFVVLSPKLNQLMSKLFVMKLGLVLLLIFVSTLLRSSQSVDYKYLRIEPCTSSNPKVVEVVKCGITQDSLGFDLILDFKIPMENILVRFRTRNWEKYLVERFLTG
jgi:hypothetical protein